MAPFSIESKEMMKKEEEAKNICGNKMYIIMFAILYMMISSTTVLNRRIIFDEYRKINNS